MGRHSLMVYDGAVTHSQTVCCSAVYWTQRHVILVSHCLTLHTVAPSYSPPFLLPLVPSLHCRHEAENTYQT